MNFFFDTDKSCDTGNSYNTGKSCDTGMSCAFAGLTSDPEHFPRKRTVLLRTRQFRSRVSD